MTLKDIAHTRLYSQQLAATKFTTVKEVVGWMGAMQAQDYAMAQWAIGARLPGTTYKTIETAIDEGEIIRTHVLRPTWHFVSPEDIYWMLELTAPQIKGLMKFQDKQLELTEAIYKKSNSIIKKALANENNLTRDELIIKLERAKIVTNDYRSGHIMLRAELEGIVCSGATKNKRQTYSLLKERAPKTKKLNRDEALKKLATKYFTSHCPATLADFIWWSGLPVKDARNALEMIKSTLVSETIGTEIYWLTNSFSTIKKDKAAAYMLPAFDEFIISYKDRSASITLENQKKAFTKNGIFRPAIVINGQVTGLWKRMIKNDTIIIETDHLRLHSVSAKTLIDKAAKKFGSFLEKKVEVIHSK